MYIDGFGQVVRIPDVLSSSRLRLGAICHPIIMICGDLAMLELRQHEALHNRQGLDPLAQYRASCGA